MNETNNLEDTDPKTRKTSKPYIVVLACVFGFLGTLPTLFLSATEVAYMEGRGFVNFLIMISILIWLSLIAIWNLNRIGIIAYFLFTIALYIILYRHGNLIHLVSAIPSSISIILLIFSFKKVKR